MSKLSKTNSKKHHSDEFIQNQDPHSKKSKTEIIVVYKKNHTCYPSRTEKTDTVVVESNVLCIQTNFFSYSSSLKKVDFTGAKALTKILPRAFDHCTSLTQLKLPPSLTDIQDFAFFQCSNLSQVEFSSSLKSVGQCAFGKCTNLTTIDLPDSIETLEDMAFGSVAVIPSLSRNLKVLKELVFGPKPAILDCVILHLQKTWCVLSHLNLDDVLGRNPEETEFEIMDLTDTLPNNTTISYLSLKQNKLYDIHIQQIISVLPSCPNLKELNLVENHLSDCQFLSEEATPEKNSSRIRKLILFTRDWFERNDYDKDGKILKHVSLYVQKNPELYDVGWFRHFVPSFLHLLDLNFSGKVLFQEDHQTNHQGVQDSVWPLILSRTDKLQNITRYHYNYPNIDISLHMNIYSKIFHRIRQLNVVYNLIREGPALIKPQGSLT